VAGFVEADQYDGKLLPGVLVARTLTELRAMLPAGLTHAPAPWFVA